MERDIEKLKEETLKFCQKYDCNLEINTINECRSLANTKLDFKVDIEIKI